MHPAESSVFIKQAARDAGFDECRIAPAEPIGRADYLRAWLDAGRAGSMDYLNRHFSLRVDPRRLLEGARSVIVVALSYHQPEPPAADPGDRPRGRVAMYAWGDDYHDVMRAGLGTLVERMRCAIAEPFSVKFCVDTAPLVEREVAATAGIGWIGKNTMVLNRELGSYFFLGAVVTTLDVRPDAPVSDHCGTCTACLDACPTDAFPAPYEMDAARCISYLTIEHRGDISRPFQETMGSWLFGCDVCQQVCPYNRSAPVTRELRFAVRPPGPSPPLDDVANWTDADYRSELRGSAIKRAKLDMLKRNARIAAANVAREAHQRSSSR